jgi:hypothetical protein
MIHASVTASVQNTIWLYGGMAMLMVKKLHKRFVEILCAVNCLIVGMSVLFIALLSVVVLPKQLKRKTLMRLGFSEEETKNVTGKGSITLPNLIMGVDVAKPGSEKTVIHHMSTGPVGLNKFKEEVRNYQDQVDLYTKQIQEGMEVSKKLLNQSEKDVIIQRRKHILVTQYGRYLDNAREDLHQSAQTIMAICEEVGTDDFVSVGGGYKIIITKDKRDKTST